MPPDDLCFVLGERRGSPPGQRQARRSGGASENQLSTCRAHWSCLHVWFLDQHSAQTPSIRWRGSFQMDEERPNGVVLPRGRWALSARRKRHLYPPLLLNV